jgi:replicative DNA helicase
VSVGSIDDARRRQPTSRSGREPPHNFQAEQSLLGAVLVTNSVLPEVIDMLAAEDFFSPAHGHIWAAFVRLWREGQPADVATVADVLERGGLLEACGGAAELVSLQAGTPSTSSAKKYASIVAEHAVLRRLIGAAQEVVERAYSTHDDVAETVDWAQTLIGAVEVPSAQVPDNFYDLDAFLDRPRLSGGREWLIPGLLRARWRCVIVAPEGVGKAVVQRAIAIGAASGVHPFQAPGEFEPRRTLIVDLENPEESIDETCIPLRDGARRMGDWQPGRAFLWHQEGGVDIRKRAHRAKFEAVLNACRPEIVCLGPLYKTFHRSKGEDTEIAAEEVQHVLDDLRTRYGFALVLEHHAPKGTMAGRELTPFGSQRWQAWPELGITLCPEKPSDSTRLTVGRFRFDRVKVAWPARIERDRPWLWRGFWTEGGTR